MAERAGELGVAESGEVVGEGAARRDATEQVVEVAAVGLGLDPSAGAVVEQAQTLGGGELVVAYLAYRLVVTRPHAGGLDLLGRRLGPGLGKVRGARLLTVPESA